MLLSKAETIAEWVRAELEPACERIVIAGSVRRQAPNPGDLELICIPKRPPVATFGRPMPAEPLTDKIAALETAGIFIGWGKNGPRYKNYMVKHDALAMKLDLFICRPPMQWGWLLVHRTGPGDFAHWLVTGQDKGGALPAGMRFEDGQLWRGETVIPTPDEESVFAALGLQYRPPHQRLARWRGKAHA